MRDQWVQLPALFPGPNPHRSCSASVSSARGSRPALSPPDAAPSRARRGPGSLLPTPSFLFRGPGVAPSGDCSAGDCEPYLAQARRGAQTSPAHLACPRSNSGGRAGGLGGFNLFAAATLHPVSDSLPPPCMNLPAQPGPVTAAPALPRPAGREQPLLCRAGTDAAGPQRAAQAGERRRTPSRDPLALPAGGRGKGTPRPGSSRP